MNKYIKSLIQYKNDQPVTTSLNVARVFHKRHNNVMKAIKKLTAQNGAVKDMFAKGIYKNLRNQEWPMYYMNRDGFALLAMGFTGKLATQFKIQFLEAFNSMALEIKQFKATPSYQIANPIKRAKRWIGEREQYEIVKKENSRRKQLQQAFESSISSVSISTFAKMLSQKGVHIGRNRLYQWFRFHHYLLKSRTDRNVPLQQYVEQGLFQMDEYPIKERNSDKKRLVHVTRLTPKGQQYFMKKFLVRK